ncbi:hypothetical protein [Nannocystis pusilla]|uniref:hypothetical protein n=1 Tax=Nannocystis pusilla TaxID=889268 RepID=UPI003B7A2154
MPHARRRGRPARGRATARLGAARSTDPAPPPEKELPALALWLAALAAAALVTGTRARLQERPR